MYAASEGLTDVVNLLLEFKSNPYLKDIDGDSAIGFFIRNGHTAIVNLLRSFAKMNNILKKINNPGGLFVSLIRI